jgi:hypothetical protein
VLDWKNLIVPMRLKLTVYLPGMPLGAQPAVSVMLVVSMLIGLNFRKAFPVFGAFAWGIPCAVGVAVLVQMIGLCIAQACKILELEKRTGRKITAKG